MDFYCAKAKLIVELDGGQHAEDRAIEYDEKRTRFLQEHGFRVIRFWNNDVLSKTQAVLMVIYNQLNSPSPLALSRAGNAGEGVVVP